jgi:hypothetical protein
MSHSKSLRNSEARLHDGLGRGGRADAYSPNVASVRHTDIGKPDH